MSAVIIKALTVLAAVVVVFGADSFNYEIGPRVSENIKYLLQEVSLATSVPQFQFQSNLLNLSDFNPTDAFLPGSQMFFVMKQLYMNKINTLNFGLENHFYYCMINNGGFPMGIELDVTSPDDPTKVSVYHVRPDGLPDMSYRNCSADPNICAFGFDCTKRPWYVQGKSSVNASWTKPFLQTFPTVPTIAIAYPMYSKAGAFQGVISANVLLDQISSFLEASYMGTDRSVFVVDSKTGYLIGSSMAADLYTDASGSLKLLKANESENYIISGATKKLYSLSWPSHLVIFDKFYLQNVPYEDAIPGVSWYIVVLMPAQTQEAALESANPLFGVVLAVSAISFIFSTSGMIFTFVYRNTRLLKLTRPPLTRLVLLACMLLSVASAVLVGPNNDALCTIRPWLLNLSFTLGLAPLLSKSYMIHYIFNLNPMQKNKVISLHWVFGFTLILLCIDCLLIGILAYGEGSGTGAKMVTQLLQNGAYGQLTVCEFSSTSFLIAEVVFKGLMLFAACYLSWQVRLIADVLAGRWGLILTVYTTTIVCGIILLVLNSVTDVPTRTVIAAIGICFCSIVTAGALTIPNCYQLLTIGDEEAVRDVMADVFSEEAARRRNRANVPRAAANSHSVSNSASGSASISETIRSITFGRQSKGAPILPMSVVSEGSAIKSDVEMLYTDSAAPVTEYNAFENGGTIAFQEPNKTDSISAGHNGSVYEFAEMASEISCEDVKSLHHQQLQMD
jgi:hypothetical protein